MATARLMLIAVVFPLVLLVSWVDVSAQDFKNTAIINGNDWMIWPEQTRLIVLYGVVSGMNMAVHSMNSDGAAMSVLNAKYKEGVGVCDAKRYAVNGVTIAQLYKGIGEIYAYEGEREIVLTDMIYFVVKWIRGCEEDEFNRVLKYVRDKGAPGAVENLVVRGASGEIVKVYEFP